MDGYGYNTAGGSVSYCVFAAAAADAADTVNACARRRCCCCCYRPPDSLWRMSVSASVLALLSSLVRPASDSALLSEPPSTRPVVSATDAELVPAVRVSGPSDD